MMGAPLQIDIILVRSMFLFEKVIHGLKAILHSSNEGTMIISSNVISLEIPSLPQPRCLVQ